MIKLIPQAKEKFHMDKETVRCIKEGALFLGQGDIQGFLYSCQGLDLAHCVIALELAGISTLDLIEEVPEYFLFCSSFTQEVVLPAQIKWIGELAFSDNRNLKTFFCAPGSKLQIIGARVFKYSEALESANFEHCKNLKQIYHGVFRNCPSLRDVYLPNPNGTLEIGEDVFSSKTTIHFPTMLKEEFKDKVIWNRYNDPQRIIYFKDGYLELEDMM